MGDANLIHKVVLFKGEFNRGNGNDMVSGVCGGGVEETTDLADGIILGDLEVLKYGLGKVMNPY